MACVIGMERKRWSPGGKERDLWARTRSAELFGIGDGSPAVSTPPLPCLALPGASCYVLMSIAKSLMQPEHVYA